MSVLDQVSALASDHNQAVSNIAVLSRRVSKPLSVHFSTTNLSLVFEHRKIYYPSSPSISYLVSQIALVANLTLTTTLKIVSVSVKFATLASSSTPLR